MWYVTKVLFSKKYIALNDYIREKWSKSIF